MHGPIVENSNQSRSIIRIMRISIFSLLYENFGSRIEYVTLDYLARFIILCSFSLNRGINEIPFKTINTYLLGQRETVCFVVPRPLMFPEAELRETSAVEGPQNILLSRGSSK